MWHELRRNEDGIALLYALFAVTIITGLIAVFVTRTLFETQQTASARDRETALHVAEGAAEDIIPAINDEGSRFETAVAQGTLSEVLPSALYTTFSTAGVTPGLELLEYTDGGGLTGDALEDFQRAWLLAVVEQNPGLLQPLERGEGAWFRPVVDDGTGTKVKSDLLFGVGFVPSYDAWRDARGELRAVRMSIGRDFFQPRFAVLYDSDLEFGGSAVVSTADCDLGAPTVEDCDADVHTNGSVTVSGANAEIRGRFSSSEPRTGTDPTTVPAGRTFYDEPEEDFPTLDVRDFYGRVELNPDPDGASVEAYDLCAAGSVGEVRTMGATTPCTGPVVWTSDDATDFLGWDYKVTGGVGQWQSTSLEPGYFYVYGADAQVTGTAGSGPRAITIIVEDDEVTGAGGGLQLSGNPEWVPALPDTTLVLEDDLRLGGAGDSSDLAGLVYVGEQLSANGNVRLKGSILVADLEDENSLVRRNNDGVSGNLFLDYDDTLSVDLAGIVVIEYWNEI